MGVHAGGRGRGGETPSHPAPAYLVRLTLSSSPDALVSRPRFLLFACTSKAGGEAGVAVAATAAVAAATATVVAGFATGFAAAAAATATGFTAGAATTAGLAGAAAPAGAGAATTGLAAAATAGLAAAAVAGAGAGALTTGRGAMVTWGEGTAVTFGALEGGAGPPRAGPAAAAIDAGELAGRGPLTTRGTTPPSRCWPGPRGPEGGPGRGPAAATRVPDDEDFRGVLMLCAANTD